MATAGRFAQTITVLQETGNGSESINVTSAGSLSSLLQGDEMQTLTDLIITGSINLADLQTTKYMPLLSKIDLSNATIVG